MQRMKNVPNKVFAQESKCRTSGRHTRREDHSYPFKYFFIRREATRAQTDPHDACHNQPGKQRTNKQTLIKATGTCEEKNLQHHDNYEEGNDTTSP